MTWKCKIVIFIMTKYGQTHAQGRFKSFFLAVTPHVGGTLILFNDDKSE